MLTGGPGPAAAVSNSRIPPNKKYVAASMHNQGPYGPQPPVFCLELARNRKSRSNDNTRSKQQTSHVPLSAQMQVLNACTEPSSKAAAASQRFESQHTQIPPMHSICLDLTRTPPTFPRRPRSKDPPSTWLVMLVVLRNRTFQVPACKPPQLTRDVSKPSLETTTALQPATKSPCSNQRGGGCSPEWGCSTTLAT